MWDNAIDALIKIAWYEKASSRYRDMISKIKGKERSQTALIQICGKDGSVIGTHRKQKRFMKRTPRIECRRQQTGLDLQLTLEALLLIMTMGEDL